MIVLDTPQAINHFALASLRGALRLEAAGMKRRGKSALSQAKALGFKARTASAMIPLVQEAINKLKEGKE